MIITLALIIININNIVNAKYIFDFEFEVAELNIDRTKPEIEYISTNNSSNWYQYHANRQHTITITVEVTEKNIGEDTLTSDEINVLINNQVSDQNEKSVELVEQNGEIYTYKITLKKLSEDGTLKVQIKKGAITDKGGLESEELLIDTKIMVINVSLTGKIKIEKNGMMYSDHFFFFFYGQKNFFMLI